jgi:transcriptional regulator with XRE-family HTH domain
MARQIVQKHGYNEKQTADLLGLSQSAVSRYVGRERGANLLSIESAQEVLALIDQMVLFCKTCTTIREKGLMCPKCQEQMPKEWAEKCFFCREK